MNARLLLAMLAAACTAMGQGGVPSGHVALTLEEYNRLLEMAAKPPKPAEISPVPRGFAIQSAGFALRAEGETVTGTVQLEGEVFHKGLLTAPLINGVTILDAKQNGRPLPLIGQGGTNSAVLSGPAEFSITIQVAMPLVIEAGRASFTLPALFAGAVRMALTVPAEQTYVNASPGLITERSSGGGKTTVQAIVDPGKPSTIWWAARQIVPPAVPKEVRFLSDVKTLVTVGEGDVAMSSLATITVVQGDPDQFALELPAGYEVTGATGATLASSEVKGGRVVLRVNNAAARSHQFLISITKPANGAVKAELLLPAFTGSQRETGEVLIEGQGTMELTAAERGGLRRMDVKEGSAQLRALAKHSIHAAFRYQKKAEAPGVAMEWVRFPDTPVLSAVAERAVVTTLVTSEGRSLTEVKLLVKNRDQTFLKVSLPPGAQILSADVSGEKVKPVTGSDGDRVPLLRPGFRPSGEYIVSFVFLHSGSPFAKKGGSELALPKMDMPVGLVTWEVFLPKQYKVSEFGGDAMPARLMPVAVNEEENASKQFMEQLAMSSGTGRFNRADGTHLGVPFGAEVQLDALSAGQLGGYVVDVSGSPVAGAKVTVTHAGWSEHTRTDTAGRWLITTVPSGRVKIQVESPGFRVLARDIDYDASRPGRHSFRLEVGAMTTTVEVSAAMDKKESQQIERLARQNAAAKDVEASPNVTALQNRVVGVLPIAVNVPHAGNSYRFVRPLVVDEETKVTFNYRVGK